MAGFAMKSLPSPRHSSITTHGRVLRLVRAEPQLAELPTEPDLRRRSIRAFAERLGYDDGHARQVAQLAVRLFDATRRLHRLGLRERELLEFAALLHDVGRSVSYSKHHKHSYYLICNGDPEGFAPEEVRVIAAIARFHRGTPPKLSHDEITELPPGARETVLRLAAILRVADSLDRRRNKVGRNLVVLIRGGVMRIYVDAAGGDASVELWGAGNQAELWERVFDVRVEFKLMAPSSRQAKRIPRKLASHSFN